MPMSNEYHNTQLPSAAIIPKPFIACSRCSPGAWGGSWHKALREVGCSLRNPWRTYVRLPEGWEWYKNDHNQIQNRDNKPDPDMPAAHILWNAFNLKP